MAKKFCLYLSSNEDDEASASMPLNKTVDHKNNKTKITNETKMSDNKKKPNKKSKKNNKDKKENKNDSLPNKKPTFKIAFKTLGKLKTKLKKDKNGIGKKKNLNVKQVEKKMPKKTKTSAGYKDKLDKSTVSSETGNTGRSKKTVKPPNIKKTTTSLPKAENNISKVRASKQNQNQCKVDRPKKKSTEIILKPNAKKFKLEVGGSSFAVSVSESKKNKSVKTNRSKRSSKSILPIPEIQKDTGNGSIQLTDGDKEPKTPSIEENVKNENLECSSNPIYVLKEVRKRFKEKPGKTLTYEELEEICMQKVCEAICYKSEIGELRLELIIQEEKSRKLLIEVHKLSKRAAELKQLHEILLTENIGRCNK